MVVGSAHPTGSSIDRYLRNPNSPEYNPQLKELDEYPPAMFLENYGKAHVRPINSSQNAGAGATMSGFLRPYGNGAQVEIITNYGLLWT
jgi:Deoxyribonuclease NucA/NucB